MGLQSWQSGVSRRTLLSSYSPDAAIGSRAGCLARIILAKKLKMPLPSFDSKCPEWALLTSFGRPFAANIDQWRARGYVAPADGPRPAGGNPTAHWGVAKW